MRNYCKSWNLFKYIKSAVKKNVFSEFLYSMFSYSNLEYFIDGLLNGKDPINAGKRL